MDESARPSEQESQSRGLGRMSPPPARHSPPPGRGSPSQGQGRSGDTNKQPSFNSGISQQIRADGTRNFSSANLQSTKGALTGPFQQIRADSKLRNGQSPKPEGRRSPKRDDSHGPGERRWSPGRGSPSPEGGGSPFARLRSKVTMVTSLRKGSRATTAEGGRVSKADKVAQLFQQQQQQPDSTPVTIRFFLNLCGDRSVEKFRKGERPAYSQLSEYLQHVFQAFKKLAGKDDLKRSRLHDAVQHCEHGLATLTGRQEKLTTTYFLQGLEACKEARQSLDSFDDVLVLSKIELTLLHFVERSAAAKRRQKCMDVMADLMGMREVIDMVTYRITGRLSFDLLWEKDLPPRLQYVLGTMHYLDSVLHTYLGKRKGPPPVDNKRTTWLALRLCHDLEPHRSDVTAIAECSHGTVLVSGNCDGTVRLWDQIAEVPKVTAVLSGHKHHVSSVVVDDEGRLVYSGGYDHAIRRQDQGVAHPEPSLPPHSRRPLTRSGVVVTGLGPANPLLRQLRPLHQAVANAPRPRAGGVPMRTHVCGPYGHGTLRIGRLLLQTALLR